MTLVSSFALYPLNIGEMKAPLTMNIDDVSIIVPVKDNPQGIHQFLITCMDVFSPDHCPCEIIIVDNHSSPSLSIPELETWGLPVKVLLCTKPGAAAARNSGAHEARGKWFLFLDSDCLPSKQLIAGYQKALNGSVAYAGSVRAYHGDLLSRYYEQQAIFSPPPLWENGKEAPVYLVTANALVWHAAFCQIEGFNERFPGAAGEDIDLGIRLWRVGSLSYAPEASVLHVTEPSILAFLGRFIRYGRANRLLSKHYEVDLSPHPFSPKGKHTLFYMLAHLQWLALWWGYHTSRP